MISPYTAEIKKLNSGRVLHFRLINDDLPLSWVDVMDRWQNDQLFRDFFMSLLINAPFPAYFWETPPVNRATIDNEFEFVLLDSPQLAGIHAEPQAFENQFETAPADKSVIEFANLSGDATLIVPCPLGPQPAYSQLSAFVRLAPEDQKHDAWKMVGATLERRISTQPVWLSTSGLGVHWVHIRFDAVPKYYTHGPYRHF